MMELIDACRTHDIDALLELPEGKETAALYRSNEHTAVEQLLRSTTVHGNVAVLDLRNEPVIYATNRFMIYALQPRCNVSVHVLWGLKQQNTVLAIGKSIIDRSCATNVGELCLRYGGGGHAAAGTCQIENGWAERVLGEVVASLRGDEAERRQRSLADEQRPERVAP